MNNDYWSMDLEALKNYRKAFRLNHCNCKSLKKALITMFKNFYYILPKIYYYYLLNKSKYCNKIDLYSQVFCFFTSTVNLQIKFILFKIVYKNKSNNSSVPKK